MKYFLHDCLLKSHLILMHLILTAYLAFLCESYNPWLVEYILCRLLIIWRVISITNCRPVLRGMCVCLLPCESPSVCFLCWGTFITLHAGSRTAVPLITQPSLNKCLTPASVLVLCGVCANSPSLQAWCCQPFVFLKSIHMHKYVFTAEMTPRTRGCCLPPSLICSSLLTVGTD